MDDIVDLLKIKIEKAKRELPLETVNAIDAVDWKIAILELRAKKGYTFEQIGDLELETELLLCGLTKVENYQKELENRLKISKSAANELVSEMNDLVFKKIREEMIKSAERKKVFAKMKKNEQENSAVLNSAGIEIIPDSPAMPLTQAIQPEKLELPKTENVAKERANILEKIENPEPTHPILTEKLAGSVQIPTVQTEHTLSNLTPNNKPSTLPKVDPYREMPE